MRYRHIKNESDLEITHTKGSGPGGQNRNKRMSGVRVVHLPSGVSVVATERRSQAQNLSAALERLDEKLARLYHKPIMRRSTAPTRSSKVKNAKAKSERSKTKVLRKRPADSDW